MKAAALLSAMTCAAQAQTFTNLVTFDGTNGSYPESALTQDTDGAFYGTTFEGSPYSGIGTAFSLSMELGPFVEASPGFGRVGAVVKILGSSLTGASSVTFNGTAATFTVLSATAISATVPAGAATGTVQVVTPGGTFVSNAAFQIL